MLLGAEGHLTPELAHYFLDRSISEQDRLRMHELAPRNQQGSITAAEKEELLAFNKAATVVSILQSKARQTLGIKLAAWTDV